MDYPELTVPREPFIPRLIVADLGHGDRIIDRDDNPDLWAEAVAADIPIVTHQDIDGPTSSNSMPYMVAQMFRVLDVKPGHNVLGIGTGTGWDSALLADRVGVENVTTVDVDREVAATARQNLADAGWSGVHVYCADGAAGWLPRAPYDRLLASCSVREIPYQWVQQTHGLIVTPWGHGLSNGGLLRLESDGVTASGRVVDEASFMWLRAHRPAGWSAPATFTQSESALDPLAVFGSTAVLFAIGHRVPGVEYVTVRDGGAYVSAIHISDGTSIAEVDTAEGASSFSVRQSGPRHLWDEIETAYAWWTSIGKPEKTDFGLTVMASGQRVWLHSPDNIIDGRAVPDE
ncbi:methyltransferase domain-containing protein [Streptomyces sp. SID13666]|uniref:methyltransferase domain-containing protein n=1 Tax=unclassified Streptomyces TaxID=2593676 RepID=UPI0013C0B07F|nr:MULTISPECIES: methyltransferase domain-containing protein [unclassified Streptomyces]NEA56924.1 methyltransferase domain-containing protein [Streptomyces sp. SID13666]NEA77262.1 methyltransferase domain-containing protein [Streptomyces sp. SID13588]